MFDISMKKITLIGSFVLFAAFTIKAQDVIVTKDSRKIEAKILEVSATEVKYKNQNNLEGPTSVISAKDLNSIMYESGEVQMFDLPVNFNNPETLTVEPDPSDNMLSITREELVLPQENILENEVKKAESIVYFASDFQGEILPKIQYSKIEIPDTSLKKKRYWGEGVIFTKKEYKKFLLLYCTDTYMKNKVYRTLPKYNASCAGNSVNIEK